MSWGFPACSGWGLGRRQAGGRSWAAAVGFQLDVTPRCAAAIQAPEHDPALCRRLRFLAGLLRAYLRLAGPVSASGHHAQTPVLHSQVGRCPRFLPPVEESRPRCALRRLLVTCSPYSSLLPPRVLADGFLIGDGPLCFHLCLLLLPHLLVC